MRKWRPKSPELALGQRVRVHWEPLTFDAYRLHGTIIEVLPAEEPWTEGQYVVKWDGYETPEYFSWSDLERLPD